MKKFKKLLSVIICFCMIFAGIIFADHTEVSATPNSYSRLGGVNRYLTSIKISQDGWSGGSKYVVIASGENYPDALCAAPLAKLYDAPILLTPHDSLRNSDNDNSLETEIKRLNPQYIFITGGTGAVSGNIETELKSLGLNGNNITITRLAGLTRYETSLKIAQQIQSNSSITGVAVASGENYPDALSIASIAAAKNMPILLTERDSMNSSVNSFIQTYNKNNTTYVIGGTGVIYDNICNALPNHKRLAGIDRYHTNIEVINEFTTNSDTSLKNLYVAYSYGFPDALSGSAEAAKDNGVILLAYYNDISDHMKDSLTYIHSNLRNINTVKVFGGTGVVPEVMVTKIINPDRTVLGFTDAGGDAGDTMTAYNSTIDEIGICKYSTESDGVIDCSTPAPNTTSYAISKGIKPLAVVSDGWNSIVHTLLSNPNYRQNFITNLMDKMGKNSCSGVNIDFESMKAVDRDNFSTFIQELSSALHKSNYLLTVSVVAKTSDNPTDNWEGPFDYYQIGKYADQVDIMTYDYSYTVPGPIAPISWVQSVINYAVNTAQIPRNKILLGLEAYGIDWSEKKDSNGNDIRTPYGVTGTYNLATKYNNSYGNLIPDADSRLDADSKCEHFNYTDESGVKHHVWYEDATSVAYKLKLVNDNDLGGVAIWQLAFPDSGYMDKIKSMLQK